MAYPPTVVGQVEPLQLPDMRRPEQMPSLPPSVALRTALLTTETRPDPNTGKYRSIPTLPANSILKAAEREELERHTKQLETLRNCTPANDPEAEKEHLVTVTKMMLVLPSAAQNEISAEVRGEAFIAALDDVPAWAVQAAIRRLYRGECGKNAKGERYEDRWCPAPADLRRMAIAAMVPLNERLSTIGALLRAEPRIEYSDEHCRCMGERLAALSLTLRASLVGKDGSGGGVSV